MPLISIIVPIYNTEAYLERCLSSLVNQTYQKLEIICVNDGSKDNSLEILTKWADSDSRIKVFCQENKGLSGARNTGLTMASGEYIGFVDSDDYIELDMYEKLLDAVEKNHADLAVSPVSQDRFEGKPPLYLTGKEALGLLMEKKMRGYVWNKLYRASILSDIRFIEGMNYEDNPFTGAVFSKVSKAAITEPNLYHYCPRQDSITRTNTKKNIQDYFRSLELLENIISKSGVKSKDGFCKQKLDTYYVLYHYKEYRVNDTVLEKQFHAKRKDLCHVYFKHFFYLMFKELKSFLKCSVIVIFPFLQKTMYQILDAKERRK